MRVQRRHVREVRPGRAALPGAGGGPADRPGRADPPARHGRLGRLYRALRGSCPAHDPPPGRRRVHRGRRRLATGAGGPVLDGRPRPERGMHPPDAARVPDRGRHPGRQAGRARGRAVLQPTAQPSSASAVFRDRVGTPGPRLRGGRWRVVRCAQEGPSRRRTRAAPQRARLERGKPPLAARPDRPRRHRRLRGAPGLLGQRGPPARRGPGGQPRPVPGPGHGDRLPAAVRHLLRHRPRRHRRPGDRRHRLGRATPSSCCPMSRAGPPPRA